MLRDSQEVTSQMCLKNWVHEDPEEGSKNVRRIQNAMRKCARVTTLYCLQLIVSTNNFAFLLFAFQICVVCMKTVFVVEGERLGFC